MGLKMLIKLTNTHRNMATIVTVPRLIRAM